jgi:hypothetical protein
MTTQYPDWLEGVRGATLRALWSEGVSNDIGAVTDAIRDMCKRRGLELDPTPNQLFSRILDYIAAHMEARDTQEVIYRGSRSTGPAGWTAEDERIWMEWLTESLSPEAWEKEVLQPVFECDVLWWECRAPRWRMELLVYVRGWVRRSRDLLAEIDPRPIVSGEGPSEEEGAF